MNQSISSEADLDESLDETDLPERRISRRTTGPSYLTAAHGKIIIISPKFIKFVLYTLTPFFLKGPSFCTKLDHLNNFSVRRPSYLKA